MKQKKLVYRFHNPNSAEDTAEFLCKIFIEANSGKVEKAIQTAALENNGEDANKEKLKVLESKYASEAKEEPVKIRRRRAG